MRKILICIILSLFSCDAEKKQKKSTVSLFSNYIHSFSGETISVGDPIKIYFIEDIDPSIPPEKVFKIEPAVKGTLDWKENKALLFLPDSPLQQNQNYKVHIALDLIYENVAENQKSFAFEFKTLKQNFEVLTEDIRFYSPNDLSKAKLNGRIETADEASFEAIKKIITASQNGGDLKITWPTPKSKTLFDFSIENIVTSDKKGFVKFEINGNPINVSKKEIRTLDVPAINTFKVLSSRVVRGTENYISVVFSNPLDEKQNLDGYVKVSNKKAKTLIDGNELKIYLRGNMSGDLNLHIFRGIKSTSRVGLQENYDTVLKLIQIKPQVRFTTKEEKAILPSSDELILPYEAIGLKAVEVSVVKVFTNNMLQYLQVNTIGEKNQLRRVSRPVVKKTIDLSALGVTNFEQWNTFSLNLSDLIKTDPSALYQIKIGFRRKHSVYQCGEDGNAIEELPEEDIWELPETETSYWDNYENYYYSSNYQWEQRDNPCNDSYYGDRRSIRKLFLASNLGIIAKRSDFGNLSVFVTNLLDTNPLENVDIAVYDYQQQLINTASTNNQGVAKIEMLKERPFALIAKKGKQTGYLKLDDFSSLSLSNFDISGTEIRQGLKGFIYGERGVWRPSDTIHLTFILQDSKTNLPEGHPVIMELYDPNNRLTYRKIKDTPVGNMFRFDFVTDKNAPTGNWKVKAKVGVATFQKNVRVETVKPNRLKINLEPFKSTLEYQDHTFRGNLNVAWLTGAKARNLKVEYEMLLKPVKTKFKGFENYVFDDQSVRFLSQRSLVHQGTLDDYGNAVLNINLGDNRKVPGVLSLMLFGKVYEEGGDFSINKTQIPYYPFKSFVGVQLPEGDKRNMLLTNKKHTLGIASVDSKGNPVSKRKIKVSLYKLNWRWWWDKSYENLSNYVGSSHQRPEYTYFTTTQNGKGICQIEVANRKWGRYYIKVEDVESGHTSGQIAYFDWPGWAGKGKSGQLDGASMLDFSLEKDSYDVGEEVSISIPSTSGNRILASLETGKDVLETFWVTTEEERTPIKFKTTQAMTPNVYVHLTMIQPHNQDKNDLPIRLYGVKNVKVVDNNTRLSPLIKLPATLTPEQTYTIKVSEATGKPMNYTLAIVDDGLLDLTNFKTPDPWESFFKKEALSVKTWDLYDNVMSAFATENTFMTTIGGDGDLGAKDEKTANRFKPVVKFLGPFSLNTGESKTHTINMPQYLGSVRTMVVAASDNAYGNVQKTTPVRQDLMVLATLPRVAGPGETMKLPVNVFSLSDQAMDVTVSVNISGTLMPVGKTTKTIRFEKEGDQLVYFDVKALNTLGAGKVKVKASSGKITSFYDIEMNVIPRNPFIAQVVSKQAVTENNPWQYDYTPLGLKGKNGAVLEISTLPPLNLENRLEYLIKYPHGCVEQITSSVFPQLYLDALVPLSKEKQIDIQENIKEAIFRLGRFQTSQGGFAYWPGHQIPSEWGSSYAGHFLLEAKNLGYAVPETLIKSWITFQTTMANNWTLREESNGLIQAYRLYTLALAKKPAMGAMNRLKEDNLISRNARWRLALAYAEAGYESQAKDMIATLETKTETASNTKHYRNTFGSRVRDRAMILETLTVLGQNDEAYELLITIAEEFAKSKWMSTQTTAYSLLAISKYIKANPLEHEINAYLTINGKPLKIGGSDKYLQQIVLEEPEKNASLDFSKTGTSAIFIRFIKKGIPLEGDKNDEKSNLNFQIDYFDTSGNPIDVSALTKGTNFSAQVTVSNPGKKGKYTELALTQIFPSGWEIINTRLDETEMNDKTVTYKDIRDDRVMHYFDLNANQKAVFTVLLNATYEGSYYLPTVRAEAMYDNTIYAHQSGKWIQILPEKN